MENTGNTEKTYSVDSGRIFSHGEHGEHREIYSVDSVDSVNSVRNFSHGEHGDHRGNKQSEHCYKKKRTIMNENEIGTIIIETCISIHRELGPGLLESVYETILFHALNKKGLKTERQVPIPIIFENLEFPEGFRADLIVENKVIIELKSVEKICNIHKKQLLTYLKLSHIKLGYLINFNEVLLKSGITRIINGIL
jgi:GxxExxY protein